MLLNLKYVLHKVAVALKAYNHTKEPILSVSPWPLHYLPSQGLHSDLALDG